MFKRWIKEPLLHFVLIGAALFAAFALLSARDDVPRDAIVVSGQQFTSSMSPEGQMP